MAKRQAYEMLAPLEHLQIKHQIFVVYTDVFVFLPFKATVRVGVCK